MEYMNRQWFYDYRELHNIFTEAASAKPICKLYSRFSKAAQSWDNKTNTEWLCRNYIAAKLIMAATLKINSIEYAESKNLRIVIPYLKYYTLLSLIRALVLTLPEEKWETGELASIPHSKAINLTKNYIASFNKKYADEFEKTARYLKASRELISYRAPSSGDTNIISQDNFIDMCIFLAESAQFNSEILEKALTKHSPLQKTYLEQPELESLVEIEIDGNSFYDKEDAYRLSYYARKQPFPCNLMFMMREGHVEDFFGAWTEKEPIEENFDPDHSWRVIFDIT